MGLFFKIKDYLRRYPSFYRFLVWLNSFNRKINRQYSRRLIKKSENYHKEALIRLQSKDIVKVLFFAIDTSSWKYDELFLKMKNHPRFHPAVVVCPMVNWGSRTMKDEMTQCCTYFRNKKYETICAYDFESDSYLDINKELQPDIVFYTNPYEGLIDDRYYIKKFLHTLTAYVPYAFNNNSNHNFAQNELLHNLVWRYYAETEQHRLYSVKYADNKGRNVIVSGYPGIEKLINKEYHPNPLQWKIKDNLYKRIIWAPHHTIEGTGCVNYSCFLMYADYMLEMAEKYKEQIQVVFKPHPLLKTKLINYWGEEKTLSYYDKWANSENTAINEGDYVDLFLTSDAMIHDSGSFITEYLYVNKPVLRTMNNVPVREMYDDLAQRSLEQYYKAYNSEDIDNFIQNVLNGYDPLFQQRTSYVNDVLMPKGCPSQIIIEDILSSIDNQVLFPQS